MIAILIISLLWAHEELSSTQCEGEGLKIKIVKQSDHTYLLSDLSLKKDTRLEKPIITDYWDQSKKQMFDTYKFEQKDFKIVFKRPETKGPIKKTFAEYQGKILNCQH